MNIRKEEVKDYNVIYEVVKTPFDVPKENFMVYKIDERLPKVNGIIEYDKVFSI